MITWWNFRNSQYILDILCVCLCDDKYINRICSNCVFPSCVFYTYSAHPREFVCKGTVFNALLSRLRFLLLRKTFHFIWKSLAVKAVSWALSTSLIELSSEWVNIYYKLNDFTFWWIMQIIHHTWEHFFFSNRNILM